jgi:glycerol kinase
MAASTATAGAPLVLAIDQGTTSTRAILFDAALRPVAVAQRELPQIYPAHGWVEHDPEAIWHDTVAVCRQVLAQARGTVAAIGIANQRETAMVWDRASGRPIHNAIVWQDRRTTARCRALAEAGCEAELAARTGLVLDPYFSASKIAWILDHCNARAAAARGALAAGTIDSFLLWRLTGGLVHATDATNAARTALYNIHEGAWDTEMLRLFGVPAALLAEVRDNAAAFGVSDAAVLGQPIAIAAMAGDQQAALIGHACFAPGDLKCTYGTGAFMIANTGATPRASANRLLTTIGYRLGSVVTYALEGSIFTTGAAVQWLRDGLGLFRDAGETADLAACVPDSGGVYLVPALTGLGAPYWDAEARGLICGIDRTTRAAHLVRAALEAVAFQTCDLIGAMRGDGVADTISRGAALRVDGGMTVNPWLMQALADLTGLPVARAAVAETTALGVACLAALQCGLQGSLAELAALYRPDRVWQPSLAESERAARYEGWQRAVRRARMLA